MICGIGQKGQQGGYNSNFGSLLPHYKSTLIPAIKVLIFNGDVDCKRDPRMHSMSTSSHFAATNNAFVAGLQVASRTRATSGGLARSAATSSSRGASGPSTRRLLATVNLRPRHPHRLFLHHGSPFPAGAGRAPPADSCVSRPRLPTVTDYGSDFTFLTVKGSGHSE